jgi:NADPH-dependent 2,4-dienoyl-CoA reductase/sulfur reductase-like enzyme
VVIVGAGQAGARVALGLRARGHDGELVLLGDEVHHPYERPPLSKSLLLGTAHAPAFVASPEEFARVGVEVRLGVRAAGVDWSRRSVAIDAGKEISFDALVVATGARPRRLPWADDLFVHYLRTLEDTAALRTLAPARVVVIGGGVIGLEVATSLQALGHAVTVVERSDQVLPRSLEHQAAAYLAGLHRYRGVDLRLGATVTDVGRDGTAVQLRLSDGSQHAVDHVVAGVGIEPNVDWLGLPTANRCNELRVDRRMRTALERVWAVGDVAVLDHPLADAPLRLESWANANESAEIAAADITGQAAPPLQAPWVWTEQAGVHAQIIGFPRIAEVTVVVPADAATSGTVFAHLRGGRLVAATLFDAPRAFRALRKLATGRAELSRADLHRPDWVALSRRLPG